MVMTHELMTNVFLRHLPIHVGGLHARPLPRAREWVAAQVKSSQVKSSHIHVLGVDLQYTVL